MQLATRFHQTFIGQVTTLGFNALRIGSFVRFATKKSGGNTSNGRTSNPKFLGFKKMNNTKVDAGNIILRQRGTEWHPGTNVGMGRDHTIFALRPGRVALHYDIIKQKRLVSVDDVLVEPTEENQILRKALFPSKTDLKQRLKDMVDIELYLSLDPKGRYDHVQKLLQQLDQELTKERDFASKELLKRQGTRKHGFSDLTML